MQVPGWLKEGAKWGGGTIGGTILGVGLTLLITSYAERARPSAEIAQIDIINAEGDLAKAKLAQIVEVPLSEDLFSELSKSVWTEAFRDPSDVLLRVISKLNRNKDNVETYLRHAQRFLAIKKDMTLLLNGERSPQAAEAFFDSWQQVDGFIYGSVRSQMRYGAPALKKLNCELEAPESHLRKLTYHKDPDAQYFSKLITDIRAAVLHPPGNLTAQPEVEQPNIIAGGPAESHDNAADEHIYSVTKVGGRYKTRLDIGSNLDENQIVQPDEERCAESVMRALADFDKEKLNAILDLTDREATNFELHKKIQDDIEKYVKGYSFWHIAALITNKGKDPISFSPNVTLYVDMSNSEINKGNTFVVDLKTINKSGDTDAITVSGRATQLINLISSKLVKDSPDWKNVIDAFERDGSRKSFVAFYPQTGWSKDVLFSPIGSFGPPKKANQTEVQYVTARFRLVE